MVKQTNKNYNKNTQASNKTFYSTDRTIEISN